MRREKRNKPPPQFPPSYKPIHLQKGKIKERICQFQNSRDAKIAKKKKKKKHARDSLAFAVEIKDTADSGQSQIGLYQGRASFRLG